MHGITFLSFSSPHPPRSFHIYGFHVYVGAAGESAGTVVIGSLEHKVEGSNSVG